MNIKNLFKITKLENSVQNIDNRNYSLEFLRFFAATCIVFVHMPNIDIADFGVDLFFILSGFVMMLSTDNSSKNFFIKRIIRIAPLYYLSTIVVFIIALIKPSLLVTTTSDIFLLIKSFLFIPFDKENTGHNPVLFVGWTLNYEMYFYLLFAIALKISLKYRDIVTTLFLSAIYLFTQKSNSLPLSAYSLNIIFEFSVGLMMYRIFISKNYIKAFILFLIIGVSLFINNDFYGRFYEFGIGSALFFMFVIIFLPKIKIPKIVIVLGGYSYAMYLIHFFIIQFFDKLTGWFFMTIYHQLFIFIISLFFVNLISFVVWRFLEIPMNTFLRNKIKQL
ncbi:acyltransferase [Candidatus Pelagibacter sp.]|nr:acyltransferase [Candidatus Pelagibacter sp.]